MSGNTKCNAISLIHNVVFIDVVDDDDDFFSEHISRVVVVWYIYMNYIRICLLIVFDYRVRLAQTSDACVRKCSIAFTCGDFVVCVCVCVWEGYCSYTLGYRWQICKLQHIRLVFLLLALVVLLLCICLHPKK